LCPHDEAGQFLIYDNDGMSDADEAVAGTNPTNRLSVLCVSAAEFRVPSS
jgi:hypothetical protein